MQAAVIPSFQWSTRFLVNDLDVVAGDEVIAVALEGKRPHRGLYQVRKLAVGRVVQVAAQRVLDRGQPVLGQAGSLRLPIEGEVKRRPKRTDHACYRRLQ